jgi:GT2 family glycosyltransferase
MSATVGIVVLNWNGGAQTITCVESVRAQDYADKFIVLVDNNSQAGERAQLLQRYGGDPGVQCCFLDSNRGYAGGLNAGLALARARTPDLVALVTHDVTFAPGALAAMVAAASDARVGIVGPKVVDAGSTARVLSVGERLAVPLLCVPRTWLRYRRERRAPYCVGGVLGCTMLLTRGCLEALGGFDEAFFAYYEEVDLCLRARRHGFLVLCAPQAVVAHDGMRGFLAGFSALSAELKARNLLRLMRRWARPVDYVLLGPTYALLMAGSLALYAARRRGDVVAALLRGTMAGLRGRGGAPDGSLLLRKLGRGGG